MLEPNDSEANLDNAEEACKSDYFSDEGDVKTEPGNDNGSSGKRKLVDVGLDETKKIKTLGEGSLDKLAKTQNNSANDFKRASSVASDNSDEFVDASDVLETTSIPDKKPKNSADQVDNCVARNSLQIDAPKSIFDSEPPKVKDRKFISRLPTFADDPLDRFNSSAIRRGFVREEAPKPIDFNFDFAPSDRNESKNENKIVRKVKLNRSKFISADKPKSSDDSSSDSNSRFNNSTSPLKTEAPSIDKDKVVQKQNEDKIAKPVQSQVIHGESSIQPTVSQTTSTSTKPIIESKSASPVVNTDCKTITESKPADDVSKSEPVDGNSVNQVINETKTVLETEPTERVINSDVIPVVEPTNEVIDTETKAVIQAAIPESKPEEIDLEPVPVITPEQTPTTKIQNDQQEPLTCHVEKPPEDLPQKQDVSSITSGTSEPLTIDDSVPDQNDEILDSNLNEVPSTAQQIDQISKLNDIIAESIDDLPIIDNEPLAEQQIEQISSTGESQPIIDDLSNQLNDLIEPLNDNLLPEIDDILPEAEILQPEVPVPEIPISQPLLESLALDDANLSPELAAVPDSLDINEPKLSPEEFIDAKSTLLDTDPSPRSVSESKPETELVQKADFDVSSEAEEDKTEIEVSNDESEAEIEEEEEEEIHEEEVYLEDRIPPPPKDPTPPPERIPSPQPEIMEIDDPEPQPSQSDELPVQKSLQRTAPLENIENIPMDVDVSPADSTKSPKELSKLEQALIGRPKKLEIQVPLEEQKSANLVSSGERADNEETKEKIKLHLSLQGDKVSIKKATPLLTPTGRVKRQYRKRNKEGIVKTDKTYKLRNRTVKKDETSGQPNSQGNSVEVISAAEKSIEIVTESDRTEKIYSAEPIVIDSDDSSQSGQTKIQPIKLKITKSSNLTIERTYSDHDKATEDRKKDPIPNYMEQAATAWSGPDLQRVERLLKESNITITPVIKETPPPAQPQSLKPIPSTKDKLSVPKFSTPSVTSTASPLQSTTSLLTPIKHEELDESSPDSTPRRQNGESEGYKTPQDGYETPISSDKQIDIKSEIRKMLASDKRKQEPRDSNDSESESDSKSKQKSVPDLVPISMPTPEMLQTLASSLAANATEGDASADKSKAEIDPAFLPLLQTLPKKRGRPTKAMVAAREALKQSQEVALENLKQLASQKASEGQHFPIPLFDITDPEDLFKPKRGRKSKTDRMDKSDAEQSTQENVVLDPIKEAEEIKRLEEERIKKEEEKERRNEIRRQKARERNDLVKAKRLRQKMKAEERQKRMQEKRRRLQEEKKKLEEEIKNLPSLPPGFDDETRMSAENSQLPSMSFSVGIGDEDSSNATTELSQRVKKSRMEVTDADSKDLTVDQIAEYQWPIQGGDLYMIQEQVSNYLGVKSFKRKYPDIKRRPVDSEERAYLVDSGLVSETLCDLGLTAISSAEVLDIMCADFPDKYEELRKYMREKQMKELSFKQKAWANGLGYKLLMADGTKQDLKKRAMESASNWNSALNKSRCEDRRCAIDLQTFIVHYPKTRTQNMTLSMPKMGSFPVSILPGQFCDFYKHYTSTELRYMPINTVIYGPLKAHATAPVDGNQTDSDDSSSSDESSTTSEGTQATEDTIEDTDKDMSVDESSILDKSHDITLLKEQMTMELSENTRELIMDDVAKILCKICLGNINRNKENVPEVLICCSQCSSTSHPTCLDLSLDMVPHIKKYAWQCSDCKSCARCKENADEDKMLFCDTCDRGYHIYCVGLKKVPSGRWQCQECTVENNISVNSTPVRDVFKEPGLIEIHDG